MNREVRRLCLDVILLDGEQDSAPSLADMAKRAKAILDGPRAHSARVSVKRKPGMERKALAKKAERDARAECRAACERRAGERCESCGLWSGPVLHMDHFWGRAREESVESCWMLCLTCDRDKTENRPSRRAWLGGFSIHCERYGYTEQLQKIDRAMALEAAQHPSAARNGRETT